MKKLYILFLFISISCLSQEDFKRFNIEAGVRVPLGKLTEKAGTSPEFGFWYRSRIQNNDMVDIGFTFFVPQSKKRFVYVTTDSIFKIKAQGISGTVGFRFCKVYPLKGSGDRNIEWLSTFGWAFFTYHDTPAELHHHQNPEPEPENENEIKINTYTKSFSTFNISQGLRFNTGSFGIQAAYNYSPYGIFSDHVPKDFGSHSLSLGITYKP